jgi:hypothetical protein
MNILDPRNSPSDNVDEAREREREGRTTGSGGVKRESTVVTNESASIRNKYTNLTAMRKAKLRWIER